MCTSHAAVMSNTPYFMLLSSCSRCYKRKYPCRYERTVKKRGPKPRSNSSVPPKKRFTGAEREETLSLPSTTLNLRPTWIADNPDTRSPTSVGTQTPDVYSTDGSFHLDKSCRPSYSPFSSIPSPSRSVGIGGIAETCRYPCLNPIISLLEGILTPEEACHLLDVFFAEPAANSSNERCPYGLSPVIRACSVLGETAERPLSPALLTVILWCVAYTGHLDIFPDTSSRIGVTQRLHSLSTKLIQAREYADREPVDDWHSNESDAYPPFDNVPEQNVDDVLSYVLLACVAAGSVAREECFTWWSKAVFLVKKLGFNSEARIAEGTPFAQQMSLLARKEYEERRRAFWLVYALDRHLSFSFNEPLQLHDSECQVLCPLPEWIWRDMDNIPLENIPIRTCGPPTQVSGTGFFEYFLPLMAILGDILELRSGNQHPRLGGSGDVFRAEGIQEMLSDCQFSLQILEAIGAPANPIIPDGNFPIVPILPSSFTNPADGPSHPKQQQLKVVIAYSRYIVRVLHMLLLGDLDGTINFFQCSANPLAIGDCIAQVLAVDSNLSFMPFLAGLYLFRGSLSFLSLADQMPMVGADDAAKQGVGAIERAHELAIKALDTPFQVLSVERQ
ncbi:hypothetical protein BDV18DRAFT_157538 [Aspergillus unguis]